MGAHLMTAFSVYARPIDRLTHVLVSPPSAESNPELFWPDPSDPDAMRVRRVDLQFPRLHALLREDRIAGLPAERRDLEGILHAIEPHLALRRTPTRIELRLLPGTARLRLEEEGRTLGTCPLTPAQAGTLLTLAEAIAEAIAETSGENGGEGARIGALYAPRSAEGHDEEHPAHRRRLTVQEACGTGFPELRPWTANEDVSKSVSRLNRRLREVPIAAHYLALESEVGPDETRYRWPRPRPAPLELQAAYPPKTWPFKHVPRPAPEGEPQGRPPL